MIAAILLAQWRSMRSFRTGGFSVAVAFSWLSGLLFYGFWGFVALGAEEYFRNPENAGNFALVLSFGLLFVLLYWQIMPIVTASMGASLDLKKLLAYPIPHGKLFLIELMLRVTTCLEMPVVLLGLGIGLLRNPVFGGLRHAPAIVGTLLVFVAINLLLTAGFRNLLEQLLRRKRAKEVLMFLLVAISVLPQFLLAKRFHPAAFGKWLPDFAVLPWSAAGRILLGASFALPVLALAVVFAAAYLFARFQFERGLRFGGESSVVRPTTGSLGRGRWEWFFEWPSRVFRDPTAAIIEKELRSLIRTPQFRFVFLMAAAFGLVLYIPNRMRGGQSGSSFMSQNILPFASVYAVLMLGNVSYFNAFGFEQSAVQAWYSYPVRLRTTVIAKNLAALAFVLVELVMVALVSVVFRFQVTAGKLIEGIVVSLICAVYLIAAGNIASVRFAHRLSPERMSQGGGSKAKNVVILAAFPILILPVGLAYWARAVFGSQLIFWGMLTFAAAFGAAIYLFGLDTAVRIGMDRRERILTDLSRGEGPVSIT